MPATTSPSTTVLLSIMLSERELARPSCTQLLAGEKPFGRTLQIYESEADDMR